MRMLLNSPGNSPGISHGLALASCSQPQIVENSMQLVMTLGAIGKEWFTMMHKTWHFFLQLSRESDDVPKRVVVHYNVSNVGKMVASVGNGLKAWESQRVPMRPSILAERNSDWDHSSKLPYTVVGNKV